MIAVIMAGGRGTRFWPKSVDERPKQFLPLTSAETMLQVTYRRFTSWLPASAVYVITTRPYVDLVAEQLPELDAAQLLLEPDSRDTGPCTALAALALLRRGIDDVLVFAPSDQYVGDADAFRRAVEQATEQAARGPHLVTLGVVPTRPETGYGYLRAEPEPASPGNVVRRIRTFIEKPDAEKASLLYREPGVFWNSGIFVWKASTIRHYMRRHQPDLWNRLEAAGERLDEVYPQLPKLSIDYAVVEKAESLYMVPVSFAWDDVGLWSSLARIREPDEAGNIVDGEVQLVNTTGSIVQVDGLRALIIGVTDLVIVSTGSGLLVCQKSEEQRIKSALQDWDHYKGGT